MLYDQDGAFPGNQGTSTNVFIAAMAVACYGTSRRSGIYQLNFGTSTGLIRWMSLSRSASSAVALLDRGVKGVHVDVDDLACGGLAHSKSHVSRMIFPNNGSRRLPRIEFNQSRML
jgi:hypothetical protein